LGMATVLPEVMEALVSAALRGVVQGGASRQVAAAVASATLRSAWELLHGGCAVRGCGEIGVTADAVMVSVPTVIASRVEALADGLLLHWASCQDAQEDIHSSREAGVSAAVNRRANSAKHAGLYTVPQDRFRDLDDAGIKKLQRGKRGRVKVGDKEAMDSKVEENEPATAAPAAAAATAAATTAGPPGRVLGEAMVATTTAPKNKDRRQVHGSLAKIVVKEKTYGGKTQAEFCGGSGAGPPGRVLGEMDVAHVVEMRLALATLNASITKTASIFEQAGGAGGGGLAAS
jgi:hypothetical protein